MSFFVRNPRMLILAIILIIVSGMASQATIPKLEDPVYGHLQDAIITTFPGAKAELVETLITEKIEEKIAEIKEVSKINSVSSVGISIITMTLNTETRDPEEVWSKVRDKLEDAAREFPSQATAKFQDIEPRAASLIIGITSSNSKIQNNYSLLERLIRDLEQTLSRISGTEKIEFFGDFKEEIIINIDSSHIAEMGISIQEIAQKIESSDIKISTGQVQSSPQKLSVEVIAEIKSLERLARIPIRQGTNSQTIYLEDIAKIHRGEKHSPSDLVYVNSKPATAISVFSESQEQLDRWTKKIHHAIALFSKDLPRGFSIEVIFEQNKYTQKRLENLYKSIYFAFLLVILVSTLMLGCKAALIVSVSLLLTIMMVLTGMNIFGIRVQQVSIIGLIISLGLLIDNAIIIVEEIQKRLHRGASINTAVSQTIRHFFMPITGSTLTTILTFIPIATMKGETGIFVYTMAVNVIISLLSSYLLSMTIIPAIAAYLYKWWPFSPSSFWDKRLSSKRLEKVYKRNLAFLYRWPLLGVVLGISLPLWGFSQIDNLEKQFFPAADRDHAYLEIHLPINTAIEETKLLALEARKLMLTEPQIADVHIFIGKSTPRFYYNVNTNILQNSSHFAQSLVFFKSNIGIENIINKLQKKLDKAFPQARMLLRLLIQGPVQEAPIEIQLYGSDIEDLYEWGNKIRLVLSSIPEVIHTRSSLEYLPKVQLKVQEEKIRELGINYADLAQQLENILEGTFSSIFIEGSEKFPIHIVPLPFQRSSIEQVLSSNITIHNNRQNIPLSAIAQLKLVPELAIVKRRNRKRVNTIQAFITAGSLPATVLNKFKKQWIPIKEKLPTDYTYEFSGEEEIREEAVTNLFAIVGILLVLMTATIVATFNSFRITFIIATVALFAVGLAIMSLHTFGYPLGFTAILGTMGLIGVAVNDSIIVITDIDEATKKQPNIPIYQSVSGSTRHVLATTVTTIAGFIPLVVNGGEMWPPLAICFVGGLVGTTLISLVFTPCCYILLKKRTTRS